MASLRIVHLSLFTLFASGVLAAADRAAVPAPQSDKDQDRSQKASERERREVLGQRVGRYDVRGTLDASLGYGDRPAPVAMSGVHEAELLFGGKLVLERTSTKVAGALSATEGWSLLCLRPDQKQYWNLSFNSDRTPFSYMFGYVVDGQLQLRDPNGAVYSYTSSADDGQWLTTYGLTSAKRPLFELEMSPDKANQARVELVAAMRRLPLVPKERNVNRKDQDAAKRWHDEHELLAQFAGDFVDAKDRLRVGARVVCAGRFLLWVLAEDGVVVEVWATGFDGPSKQFAHWRVTADEQVPRYFRGAFKKDKLTFEAYKDRGRLTFDASKDGRLDVKRSGSAGVGRLKLKRE